MLAELGHFSLILSLCLAAMLTGLPFLIRDRTPQFAHQYLYLLSSGIFLFLGFSFITLMLSFLADDFSLIYVATNSSSSLPWFYKLTAVWGAHEGSMLLWCLLLAGWLLWLVIRLLKRMDMRRQFPRQEGMAISLTALVLGIFLAFILWTSNPFARRFPAPFQGTDLNPLLQDWAFIIHPPLLYMGYVGFVICCALALSSLICRQRTQRAGRLIRPWANYAWAFLGLGIALGSWWAYYELGWGGWWFWDPVENSALMPWLTGAALVHSLRVAETRGQFHRWIVFLALVTFSLSLFGAFLVRSGILSSVHSFAEDKQRGVFLLLIWVLLSAAGWGCLMRAHGPALTEKTVFWSRPGMLLINNILLVFSMFCILVGTVYPLLTQLVWGRNVSIGAPYFVSLIAPVAVVGGLAAAAVVLVDWNRGARSPHRRVLFFCVIPCLLVAVLVPLLYGERWSWAAFGTLSIGTLILCSALVEWTKSGIKSLGSPHRIGLFLGHSGFALLILGAGLNNIYHKPSQFVLGANEEAWLRGNRFVVRGFETGEERNYRYLRANMEVFAANGRKKAELSPTRRLYGVRNQLTTESAIAPGLMADLLVTLGAEKSRDRHVFTLHYHPFVRWVWLAMLFIGLGSVLASRKRRA